MRDRIDDWLNSLAWNTGEENERASPTHTRDWEAKRHKKRQGRGVRQGWRRPGEAVLSRGSRGNMGNQLAEERHHRAVRYEASSIVRPLVVAAGFDRVVGGILAFRYLGSKPVFVAGMFPITSPRANGSRQAMDAVGVRPPSSSLSYPGAGANDDARSPGSGGTPGPLSQQAPASLDSSDPGVSQDRIDSGPDVRVGDEP
ncbi:Homeobox protein homothorax [Ooceraea biroi]|uniref:Homeobox protein homothorax n=1 Tax=Ooceraea biroi TaxID=2015173 RepID=A0A026W4F9_OOCBI|nr:Homeobox protein homothorax [Ooceraea biroi]